MISEDAVVSARSVELIRSYSSCNPVVAFTTVCAIVARARKESIVALVSDDGVLDRATAYEVPTLASKHEVPIRTSLITSQPMPLRICSQSLDVEQPPHLRQ